MEFNFEIFGAFASVLGLLFWFLNEKNNELKEIRNELREERKDHAAYVDKVSEALIMTNKRFERNGS